MTSTLARSYSYCEQVARREAGDFYPAFPILPRGQRQAMCALYAFLRIADDLGDGPDDGASKHRNLAEWRRGLDRALRGDYSHRLHEALHHTVETCQVPREYLEAVLDGVEVDLVP